MPMALTRTAPRSAREARSHRPRSAAGLLALAAGLLLLAGCGEQPRARSADPEPDLAGVDLARLLDCAREQRLTWLQAHRAGPRPGKAENSLGAIEASLADGALFLELDVARTADDVLVLMHDETVDRTTTGRGRVGDLSYARFSRLELVDERGEPTWESPPSLAEALLALEDRGIAQLDLKDVDFRTLAATLEAADAVDRVVVITYSLTGAIELHGLLPEVMLSVGIAGPDDLVRLLDAGIDLRRVQAWLGLGTGDPGLDARLAERGLETSYGDFRAEREGTVDYRRMAANGAEVLSVDDVPAAAAVLDAADARRALAGTCPAAF